ncbi:MAG: hypothetical protein AAF203_00755, partial [Pseudomonadota bacterium]
LAFASDVTTTVIKNIKTGEDIIRFETTADSTEIKFCKGNGVVSCDSQGTFSNEDLKSILTNDYVFQIGRIHHEEALAFGGGAVVGILVFYALYRVTGGFWASDIQASWYWGRNMVLSAVFPVAGGVLGLEAYDRSEIDQEGRKADLNTTLDEILSKDAPGLHSMNFEERAFNEFKIYLSGTLEDLGE